MPIDDQQTYEILSCDLLKIAPKLAETLIEKSFFRVFLFILLPSVLPSLSSSSFGFFFSSFAHNNLFELAGLCLKQALVLILPSLLLRHDSVHL